MPQKEAFTKFIKVKFRLEKQKMAMLGTPLQKVSQIATKSYTTVSKKFQTSFKNFSRTFQQFFKHFTKKFQNNFLSLTHTSTLNARVGIHQL